MCHNCDIGSFLCIPVPVDIHAAPLSLVLPVYVIRWDRDSDKCLLIGTFKHGYEKYNLMRADTSLLFLTVCGPPDGQALRKEQQDEE